MTNPDAPTTLSEDYTQRTATTLGLVWYAGDHDGGSPVIDYTVTFD